MSNKALTICASAAGLAGLAAGAALLRAGPGSPMLRAAKTIMKIRGTAAWETLDLDVAALRRGSENNAKLMRPDKSVAFEPLRLGGVDAEIARPPAYREDAIVLYIHGGGFISGSFRHVRAFTAYFALESEMEVYCADYRLAPEHPYPAAPDDCLAAYRALLELHPEKKIFLLGESAGANLVLVTALRAKDEGLKLPAGVVAYAPVADMTGAVDRAPFAKTEIIISALATTAVQRLYCPEGDLADPCVSPFYGDYAGFPPLRLVWDGGEALCPDGVLLRDRARAAGADIEAKQWEGTFHAFALAGKAIPESRREIADSIAFIRRRAAAS